MNVERKVPSILDTESVAPIFEQKQNLGPLAAFWDKLGRQALFVQHCVLISFIDFAQPTACEKQS